MSACTCRRNDYDEILSHDFRCPVDEHAERGHLPDLLDKDDLEYLKAERDWNWDMPRGGL